jgi:hypothetical protein
VAAAKAGLVEPVEEDSVVAGEERRDDTLLRPPVEIGARRRLGRIERPGEWLFVHLY